MRVATCEVVCADPMFEDDDSVQSLIWEFLAKVDETGEQVVFRGRDL